MTSTSPTSDQHGPAVPHDEPVVVIIGSGAGGGTMAHELTTKRVRCVVLEAGRYLQREDYVNDEWQAFTQMAWLDMRTTSGSWRIARDFPNLPAWIVKAVGGTTTHWSGATPRFMAHEFAARSTYGDVEGANLLDWPIALEDLAPYYDRAEKAIGSTHRHGRPPLPANNNYKVFANGAERVGYKYYATGPYGTNAEPYDGRPSRSRTAASTFRATSPVPSGRRRSGRSRERWRRATWTCARSAMPCGSCTTTPVGPARWSTSTPTATCTTRPPARSAWPATPSRRPGCC